MRVSSGVVRVDRREVDDRRYFEVGECRADIERRVEVVEAAAHLEQAHLVGDEQDAGGLPVDRPPSRREQQRCLAAGRRGDPVIDQRLVHGEPSFSRLAVRESSSSSDRRLTKGCQGSETAASGSSDDSCGYGLTR
jgi:hypothetical protein